MNSDVTEKQNSIDVFSVLNEKPKYFVFSAELLPPFGIILTACLIVFYIILGLSITTYLAIASSLCLAWWIVTGGEDSYKFTDKLFLLPGKRYFNSNTLFVPATDPGAFKRKLRNHPKPEMISNRKGKKEKVVPFQIESDLHAIVEIEFGQDCFALLLRCDRKGRWSATIPFILDGIHTQLYDEEVKGVCASLKDALQDIPGSQTVIFKLGCRSKYRRRIAELNNLYKQATTPLVKLLLHSDKQRVKDITQRGFRQEWDQYALINWKQNDKKENSDRHGVAQFVDSIVKEFSSKSDSFTGIKSEKQRNIYCQLAKEIYEQCYSHWNLLLSRKASLGCRPMTPDEVWEDLLWYRFNQGKAPPIPQLIKVTKNGRTIKSEIKVFAPENPKDTISVLLQGERGMPSVPQHAERRDLVAVNGDLVGAMVMEKPVKGWENERDQLDWLWKKLISSGIKDTEIFLEVSNDNRKQTLVELTKLTKQSTTENAYAIKDGEGLSVGATFRQREALLAQARLHKDATTLYGATTILVYRKKLDNLNQACNQLAKSLSPAVLVREKNVCWKIWNETLPTNNEHFLKSSQIFSERRFKYDSISIRGVMPLRKPQPLHHCGVELVDSEAGSPIYLNFFDNNSSERAIVAGSSGSGKSVFLFSIVQQALAHTAKVVGVDASKDGESTFKLATQLLGVEGAYIDMANTCYNIMQPPNVMKCSSEEREKRKNIWKNSLKKVLIAMAMGNIDNQELYERVDSILVILFDVFFNNPRISRRYNKAMDAGWQSLEWQNMPVLEDLLSFCSREKLGLDSFSEMDERAIAQIDNQIKAKTKDPNIGKLISRPSTIPPLPSMTFFALSGLGDGSNSMVMALVAQMACLNVSLENPKTLFVMDECSVLFKKRGFADFVGELCATGRKEGMSVLIAGQDIDSIVKCSAAAQILENVNYSIIGKTTPKSTDAYVKHLKIPREIIAKNIPDSFKTNKKLLYSNWLICSNSRYWHCRYYPSLISLAVLANEQHEKQARKAIFSKYPNDSVGIIRGLKEYSKHIDKRRQSKTHPSEEKKELAITVR